MKKLAYIILSILLLSGCKHKELIPPRLEVIPQDTLIKCSNITPAFIKINAFGNEDLKSFRIETNPIIYRFDTSFQAFTHSYTDSFTIKIPEGLTLPSDSIIIASFTLTDPYNSTTVVKHLKVMDAYPDLIQDTITLFTPLKGKCFLDLSTHQTSDTTAEPGSFDIAFIIGSDGSYILASPDAPWLASTLNDQNIDYTIDNQRFTKIQRSLVDYDAMDDKYVYYMTVTERYLYNTPSYGVGIEALSIGNTLTFQAQDGRKGAIKVLTIHPADSSIVLAIKYQCYPAK